MGGRGAWSAGAYGRDAMRIELLADVMGGIQSALPKGKTVSDIPGLSDYYNALNDEYKKLVSESEAGADYSLSRSFYFGLQDRSLFTGKKASKAEKARIDKFDKYHRQPQSDAVNREVRKVRDRFGF